MLFSIFDGEGGVVALGGGGGGGPVVVAGAGAVPAVGGGGGGAENINTTSIPPKTEVDAMVVDGTEENENGAASGSGGGGPSSGSGGIEDDLKMLRGLTGSSGGSTSGLQVCYITDVGIGRLFSRYGRSWKFLGVALFLLNWILTANSSCASSFLFVPKKN